MKKTKAEYWAVRINAEWRKSHERTIAIGRELIAAKKACEHGEFLRLFKGSQNEVSQAVPFGEDAAERFMRVASHRVLSNSDQSRNLPQSYQTLYELTKLGDEQIISSIKAGEIHAEMSRADATALRSDAVEHPERELCVLAWEALSLAYAKYADKLGEDDRLFVLERLESLVRLIKQEASPDASRRQRGGRPEAANAAG